jgi:uncharacterized protein (UPF0248 family)
MTYPREVLNEIKWRNGSLSGVVIYYLHRGAPEDMAFIKGDDIVELGRSFFHTRESSIPYHRITKIEKGGEVVFSA